MALPYFLPGWWWRRVTVPAWVIGAGLLGHAFGAWPLVRVGTLIRQRPPLDVSWLWMALAFAVSFVADTASLFGAWSVVSQTYPLMQGALFALALLPSRVAGRVVALLLAVAGASVAVRHGQGVDVALHVAAWLSVAVMAWWRVPDFALRWTLVLGFVGMAATWTAYALAPDTVVSALMQTVRVVTACAWGVAAWREAER
jgi:hypothetical protein